MVSIYNDRGSTPNSQYLRYLPTYTSTLGFPTKCTSKQHKTSRLQAQKPLESTSEGPSHDLLFPSNKTILYETVLAGQQPPSFSHFSNTQSCLIQSFLPSTLCSQCGIDISAIKHNVYPRHVADSECTLATIISFYNKLFPLVKFISCYHSWIYSICQKRQKEKLSDSRHFYNVVTGY